MTHVLMVGGVAWLLPGDDPAPIDYAAIAREVAERLERLRQEAIQEVEMELPKLRRVHWCNNSVSVMSQLHGDYGTVCEHFTTESSLSGKTLCGKRYPRYKGYPSPAARYCKGCVKKAYKLGFPQGFTKAEMEWVPSSDE